MFLAPIIIRYVSLSVIYCDFSRQGSQACFRSLSRRLSLSKLTVTMLPLHIWLKSLLHITLYEEHPDALYVLCKLPEATIMLLVGLWSL